MRGYILRRNDSKDNAWVKPSLRRAAKSGFANASLSDGPLDRAHSVHGRRREP